MRKVFKEVAHEGQGTEQNFFLVYTINVGKGRQVFMLKYNKHLERVN